MKYSESTVKNLVIAFVLILIANTFVSYSIGNRDGFKESEWRYNIEPDSGEIHYGQLYFTKGAPYNYSLYVSEGDTMHHLFDYHHIGGLILAPR